MYLKGQINIGREMLKCKFCSYIVPKWMGRKGRKPRNATPNLLYHAMMNHKEDYYKIQKNINADLSDLLTETTEKD